MKTETSSATQEIEATIRDYIEGWYRGDAARMDRCLHPDLVKRTRSDDAGPDGLRDVSKDRMVRLTEDGGGGQPESEYEIEIHHVAGSIASGLVHSYEYLDYLHLVETRKGWRIVNVLFQTHD